jgi:hypothetical protein
MFATTGSVFSAANGSQNEGDSITVVKSTRDEDLRAANERVHGTETIRQPLTNPDRYPYRVDLPIQEDKDKCGNERRWAANCSPLKWCLVLLQLAG